MAAEARRVAAERMGEAAAGWLASLDTGQRAKALRPFEDVERDRWFYTPTIQAGLPLLEMDPPQQLAAHRLVLAGLSLRGYVTAGTIMGLENILATREGLRDGGYHGYDRPSRNRDPQLYFLAIFGEPGADRWGWRFGGHHISLNYTIVRGAVVSPTPTFFGADPAECEGVGANTLRPLAAEEDIARELLHSLDAGARASVVVAPVAPMDLVQGNRPRVIEGGTPPPLWEIFSGRLSDRREEMMRAVTARSNDERGLTPAHIEAVRYTAAPKGLPAGAMSEPQREMVRGLLRQFVDRLPEDLAAVKWAEIEAAGIEQVHFLWAGGIERGQGHYYRLQGPRLLVEYDNVQNGANHIHTVWRDPEGDFGYDVLAEHYAAGHGR
jgi:hypothetical protein